MIRCDFELCVFQRNGICLKESLHVNRFGACNDRVTVTVEDAADKKQAALEQLENECLEDDRRKSQNAAN